MMEGKPVPASPADYSKEVKAQAAEHLDLARALGVDGTPTFYINGQQIVVADMERIKELLK
jgi:thiol:disulfide interchange protein DsbC